MGQRPEETLHQRIDLPTWGEGGEGEMYGVSNMETYITICKIDSKQNLLYGSGNRHFINLEG